MTQLKFNVATCVSYYADIKGGCRDRRKMGERYDKGTPRKVILQARQGMYVHIEVHSCAYVVL